jgi:septal ring factor EnvC (AmiA/AmiB activator)
MTGMSTATPTPPSGPPMPDDFTGTNTDKIDKLITAVVEIRTTLRNIIWALSTVLPLLLMFGAYLVVTANANSTKIERLTDRVESMDRQNEKRFDAIDKRFEAIDKRFDGVEKRLSDLERQQKETNERLVRIEETLKRLVDKLDRQTK